MKNSPAFPVEPTTEYLGLTKREIFYLVAMHGYLANGAHKTPHDAGWIASMADHMIAELQKEPSRG